MERWLRLACCCCGSDQVKSGGLPGQRGGRERLSGVGLGTSCRVGGVERMANGSWRFAFSGGGTAGGGGLLWRGVGPRARGGWLLAGAAGGAAAAGCPPANSDGGRAAAERFV